MLILKAQILKKLSRRDYWGGRHTAFDDLPKSIPKTPSWQSKRCGRRAYPEELLIPKQTGYGLHVSLNPQRKAEIDKLIKDVLNE